MKNLKYLIFALVMGFMCLGKVDAAYCVYEYGEFSIACNITNGVPNCESKSENNSIHLNSYTGLISAYDKDKDEKVACSEIEKIYLALNATDNSINISDIFSNKNACETSAGSNCLELSLNKQESKDDGIRGNGFGGGTSDDTSKPSFGSDVNHGAGFEDIKDNELDLENFCKGPVQGAFTTLGWIFYILKILVPLILIVFGCIDFFKAVIASKDDEVKKAAKTLGMRIISGIIIFFIPTIIGFVVKFVDDDNVYRGTFADCTACMLDPNHEFDDGRVCSSLRGN